MRKGEQTQALILDEALNLASVVGLEGLTVGALADRLGLSKSGLFAHFGSKEDLQIRTLRRAQTLFQELVLRPALDHAPGLPQLQALFSSWLAFLDGTADLPGGCLMLAASFEYDDRPGPVRDLLVAGQRELRGAIAKLIRRAIEEGQLAVNADPWQSTFELFGIVLAANYARRLLNDPSAFERARTAFDRQFAWRADQSGPTQADSH